MFWSFASFEANSCNEASFGLVAYSLVLGSSAGLGSWSPDSPVVLFKPKTGLFRTEIHYVSEGQWAIRTQKYDKNWGRQVTRVRNPLLSVPP